MKKKIRKPMGRRIPEPKVPGDKGQTINLPPPYKEHPSISVGTHKGGVYMNGAGLGSVQMPVATAERLAKALLAAAARARLIGERETAYGKWWPGKREGE